MPQTLEDFVRGTPWKGEVDRLREIETVVIVLVTAIGQHPFDRRDNPAVRDECIANLRALTGRKAVR
jgi:hypothetical protein